ncbi:MAG: sigma-E factor regulatory protein RseB domain-containing protein [Elusimicrobiota bacterium]
MPRIPNWSSALAALLLAAAGTAFARADETPEPAALLDAVLAPPTVSYKGHVLVQQWFGKQQLAEEMRVYVEPPDRIRREFLSLDGAPKRVSISDGDVESVLLVHAGKTVRGNAVRSYDKVLPPDLERDTLLSNYELLSSTGEKVAGRPTWRLTLKPKVDGKSWVTLWIDQDTDVVLRNRRYLPHRRFASVAQFLSFEPGKKLDPALFKIEESSTGITEARGLSPEFMTLEQLNQATGDQSRLPLRLPGGFVFESADVFPVGKSKVRHARYTDGLTVISIFQTDRPVRLPKGGIIPPGDSHLPGALRASRAGKLIEWGSGARHYTLMGDVSKELVAEIIKSLR